MTRSTIIKIIQSIQECDRYIEKEDVRDADLRPPEIQKRLEFYKAHRAKLVTMMDSNGYSKNV
jgi:adenosine deaminase